MMIANKKRLEALEMERLAPYAVHSAHIRGRKRKEPLSEYRTEIQRDRDRIIHSTAFRRLEYKTQVFLNHEGDHYRTRLTHSMEVAQIARTIARSLCLNEDLSEAIALAHDIGHTPFGHAGEEKLNAIMASEGGFDHNFHGFRVVSYLEKRYPLFDGLNLTWDVREGILKHRETFRRAGRLDPDFCTSQKSISLEAQIVNIADEIAYASHDIDDGLRAGLMDECDLMQVSLWKSIVASFRWKDRGSSRYRYMAIRALMNMLIENVIVSSCRALKKAKVRSVDDVRATPELLIRFSDSIEKKRQELRRFLFLHVYKHHRVVRMTEKAKRVMEALFENYLKTPDQLPPHVHAQLGSKSTLNRNVICDYIAGMTDRFAIDEYKKIFDPYEKV